MNGVRRCEFDRLLARFAAGGGKDGGKRVPGRIDEGTFPVRAFSGE